MNILFFLIPKNKVAYIYDDFTLRQTLEKMEHHKYSAIPVLSRDGKYKGTITEGDILWALKNNHSLNLKNSESTSVSSIPRKLEIRPVNAQADMRDLIEKAMNQNFVPVIDDWGSFIGIITRKDIIEFCYSHSDLSDAGGLSKAN
ncbi:MAG: CBS domain-containing protein [Ruminococcaceae bacterium]|nr:CBS domain-containing protein [Oscillospiraceae bacterium]